MTPFLIGVIVLGVAILISRTMAGKRQQGQKKIGYGASDVGMASADGRHEREGRQGWSDGGGNHGGGDSGGGNGGGGGD